MDGYASKHIVNRDEPIPVIKIPQFDNEDSSSADTEQQKLGKRERFRQEADRLKEKLHDVSSQYKTSQGSVQERLFNTCVVCRYLGRTTRC